MNQTKTKQNLRTPKEFCADWLPRMQPQSYFDGTTVLYPTPSAVRTLEGATVRPLRDAYRVGYVVLQPWGTYTGNVPSVPSTSTQESYLYCCCSCCGASSLLVGRSKARRKLGGSRDQRRLPSTKPSGQGATRTTAKSS